MTVDEAKTLLGHRFDADLARFLEVTPQSVVTYRKAGALPKGCAALVELEVIRAAQPTAQQAEAAQE